MKKHILIRFSFHLGNESNFIPALQSKKCNVQVCFAVLLAVKNKSDILLKRLGHDFARQRWKSPVIYDLLLRLTNLA